MPVNNKESLKLKHTNHLITPSRELASENKFKRRFDYKNSINLKLTLSRKKNTAVTLMLQQGRNK